MKRELKRPRVLILAFLVLGLVYSGCDIGGVAPLDMSRVQTVAFVRPVSENQLGGPIEYQATCQIENTSADDGHGDFSSAVVTVNSVSLSTSNAWLFHSPNVGTLSAGDTVILDIWEPRLGHIQVTAAVPVSVTSFMLNPSLPPHGTWNTQDAYQMSWTGSGAGRYLAGYLVYDDGCSMLKGALYDVSVDSYAVGPSDLVYEGTLAPFVKFVLHTISVVEIAGFTDSSKLRVSGVTVVSQDNM